MSETIFFPDTNVILHCKSLEDLPWSEVTPADTIRVILAGIVCAQLDRLKNDGNSRRAKRARKASSRCDEILDSKDQKILIRESSPTVTLELAPAAKPKAADFPDLDLSYEDDRLVAETLNFARANPSLDVRLLTDDVGPKRTAKGHGLPYASVPGDGWRLAPENDPRDKEIIALRQENERLRSEYTSISARLQAESGSIIDRIEIQFPWYPELKSNEISELINFANERLTSRLDAECRKNSYTPLVRHPAKQRLEECQEKWAQELKTFLEQLHTAKCEQIESEVFTLVLSCDGVRPGDNVKVSIEATGTVLLAAAGEPIFWNREVKIPAPPSLLQQPPSPRPTSLVPSYQFVVDLRVRRPDVFYRDTHPPARCSKLEYSCPEFTHKGAESRVEFRIKPASDSKNGPNGLLQYTIRARNLPDPVSHQFGVSFALLDKDTFSLAKNLIETGIPQNTAGM